MDPKERQRLAALRSLNILDTPPEERFDRITRLAQRTFGVPIALISFIDEKRVWFKSRMGLELAETPRTGSFCEESLNSDAMLVVPDASQDPRFAAHPIVTGDPKIRFYAGQPVLGPAGEIIGTLSLLDTAPRDIDNEQRRALRDLADMVQEQLSEPSEPPPDEHSRLLARLRLTPEYAAMRRKVRTAFLIIAVILITVTGLSLRLADRLVTGADEISSVASAVISTPEAIEMTKAPLERLNSTTRFFRLAVGMRALTGLTLLFIVLVIYDRHMDARLSAMAAVELDRARMRAVIDAIGDGVVVTDARGRFTVFNPAAERILGLGMVDNPEETGPFYRSFFTDAGTACPPEKHPLMRAIAGESVHGVRLVVRNERRPGGVPVVITATPVRSFDGAHAGGVIIFRDVI